MKVKPGVAMRIGELSRATGVNGRLLRYYEEQGLLRPVRRPNGYRDYAPSDVTAVFHIRALLAAGLPTTVIAQVLHCVHGDAARPVPAPCSGLVGHLTRERARITAAMTRLTAERDALDDLLSAAGGPAAGNPSVA